MKIDKTVINKTKWTYSRYRTFILRTWANISCGVVITSGRYFPPFDLGPLGFESRVDWHTGILLAYVGDVGSAAVQLYDPIHFRFRATSMRAVLPSPLVLIGF